MATQAQANRLRRALRDVNTLAARDLLARWRTYNLADAVAATRALLADLPVIAEGFAGAAATVAADWYEDVRGGGYTATTAEGPALERVEALARWGTGPLWGAGSNPALALSLIGGGLQRIVANGARDTIVTNTQADPGNPRVARHASANACAFCALLATRGAVYTQETGGFDAHDNCHCIAVPVFGDEYEEPPYVTTWRDAYQQAKPHGDGTPTPILAHMRKTLGTN